MIEITKKAAFIPANNDEANGEIMGRCNALHDWLMKDAEDKYFSSDCQMVCTLMGFRDVVEHHIEYVEELRAAEMEKASGASAD